MSALRSRSVLVGLLLGGVLLLIAAALEGAPSRAASPSSLAGQPSAAPGVELPQLRTETSRTFQTGTGARLTRVYPHPINFRDNGRWAAIDNTLVDASRAGYVHRRANAGDALIPTDLGNPIVVSRGSASVSFTLRDASSHASVAGSEARFADAQRGVDTTYAATNTGVKETLTLQDSAAARVFSYDVSASAGLQPHTAPDGAIVFRDRDGDDRFAFTPPVVWDAADNPSVSHASTMTIAPTASGWRLTVAVDRGWFEDHGRVFPVTVDPGVQWLVGGTMRYSGAQRDCTLASAMPSTSLCSDPTLTVGSDSAGSYRFNLFFDARSAIPQDATVYDAKLQLHAQGSGSVPASNIRARLITSSWTNAATWNTRDGTSAWTTPGGDVGSGTDDVGPAKSIGTLNSWYQPQVPAALVQGWIWGDQPDYGVQVSADAGSPTQTYSFESTEGDPNKWPALDIYWDEDQGNASFYTQDRQTLGDRSEIAVNVANGNLTYTANEISLPGTAGLDLGVTRNWQSVSNWNQGGFGRGWYGSYEQTWTRDDADGSVYYVDMTGHHSRFAPLGSGTFKTPSGVNASLCEIDVATGCSRDGVTGPKYKLTENGSGRKYYYFQNGRLGTIKDRNGNTITLTWGSSSVTVAGTQGRQLTMPLDASGHYTSIGDGARTTSYSRDANDLLQSSTDLDGKTWQYEYNADSYLTKITDPLGHETRIEWEWVADFGSWRATKVIRVLDSTDPTNPAKNPTTTYSYDVANRTTVVTNPVGNSTTLVTNDGQTTYHYDKHLRVTAVTNPKGLEADTTWTDNSDVRTFEDQPTTDNRQLTTFGYDAGGLGNLTSVDRGAGEKSTMTYYASGAFPQSQYAAKSSSGPDNQSQYFSYDGAGNLTGIADGDASDSQHPTVRNDVSLGYGSSGVDGTVRTATDGNGNTTTFGYTNHRLTSVAPQADAGNSVLGTTTLTYDGLGRVATVQDGRGITHTFSYDTMDRVTKDQVNASSYVHYAWDALGNLTQRKEVQGASTKTTDYGYDALNRRTSETFPGYSDTYTYTLNSQLATLTEPGGTTSYDYDPLDRVAKVTDPTGAHVDWTYDDTGTSTSPRNRLITFPDSSMTQRTDFDRSGKPTLIVVKSGTTVRSSRAYEYTWTPTGSSGSSQGSKISKVTDQDGTVTTYQYGQDGELVDATRTTSGGVVDEWVYSFDKATNRKTATKKHTGQPDVVTTYSYNKDNQLCWSLTGSSSAGCGSPPAGATTYSYDADGNQVTGGPGGSFAFDSWNRLTTIGSTSLGYLSPTNGELVSYGTTSYTNNVLGLSSQTTGTSKTYYVRDPSGAAVAQRRYGGSTYLDTDYLLSDSLGSTVGLVNGTSTSLVRSYTYDPDGNATSTGTGATTDLKFAGGYALSAGLYHFGARYYNPAIGRWTQQDPLNQAASLTEANRYAYLGENPVNGVDLTGTISCSTFGVGGACKAAKRVATQTVRHPLKALSVVDTALDTAAVGSIATAGTAACVGATAGMASAACAGIAATAGTAAVGGAYVTYREGKEFYEEDE